MAQEVYPEALGMDSFMKFPRKITLKHTVAKDRRSKQKFRVLEKMIWKWHLNQLKIGWIPKTLLVNAKNSWL